MSIAIDSSSHFYQNKYIFLFSQLMMPLRAPAEELLTVSYIRFDMFHRHDFLCLGLSARHLPKNLSSQDIVCDTGVVILVLSAQVSGWCSRWDVFGRGIHFVRRTLEVKLFMQRNQLKELILIWEGISTLEIDCIWYYKHFSILISTVFNTVIYEECGPCDSTVPSQDLLIFENLLTNTDLER